LNDATPNLIAYLRNKRILLILDTCDFLPGLRVLSRVSPSTPSAMNRACHRHTTCFDLPDRRMISAVPQPSSSPG
jgi:hypothetical protein